MSQLNTLCVSPKSVFEAFCYANLHLGYNKTINGEQFNEVFDFAISLVDGCNCEAVNFKQDITKVACLMLEEGIDDISYLHKSILEYYCASFLKRLSDENSEIFYDDILNDDKIWVDVLDFLKSIDAYRYYKNYAKKIIEMHRKNIIEKFNAPKERGAADVINEIMPGVGVYYVMNYSASDVRIAYYGPIPRLSGSKIGGFDFLVLDALRDAASPSLSISEFVENFGPTDLYRGGVDNELHVPIKMIEKAFGDDAFKRVFGIFESRLIAEEVVVGKHLSVEAKKKSILFKRK